MIIPVSLYVSVELVKLGQVYFINQDIELYYEPAENFSVCRATTINEDLGQIRYVFSDKTGTLTENKMILKRFTVLGTECSIAEGTFIHTIHLYRGDLMGVSLPRVLLLETFAAIKLPSESSAITAKVSWSTQHFALCFSIFHFFPEYYYFQSPKTMLFLGGRGWLNLPMKTDFSVPRPLAVIAPEFRIYHYTRY